jgi:glycosyltransferase involved in cell wall biosynthesis
MARPIHVLELRSVRGTGGGPEKTILHGAIQSNPERTRVAVCYIRDVRDEVFGIDAWAERLGVNYAEIRERHSFDPSIWARLKAIVAERSIDIVHAHDYKTNLLAILLARATGVLPLATEHGWTGHSWRERSLYYPADKWLARRFPRIVAVSGDIRRELLRHGCEPDRVVTVLNGIDPDVFRRDPSRRGPVRDALGLSADDVVIGSAGRLEPQKRFDLLIDAIAALRTSNPHYRLVIAGDGSLRGELEARCARLGLGSACLLLGHRTDVGDLHHAFDLFVQSSDYEGTPNTVLEAMAMETPVIATDAGGTAELVYDRVHGRVVAPGSSHVLADTIATVLAAPAVAATRVRAARLRIERQLSFQARTRRLEDVYASLVAGRAGAAATREGAAA